MTNNSIRADIYHSFGRYPTRGYQQRQPSLKRDAADQTDLENQAHGTSVLRNELTR